MPTSIRLSALLALVLFCVQPIFSQTKTQQTTPQPHAQRSCSSMDLHEQKMQTDKAYQKSFYDKIANSRNVVSNLQASADLCPNPVIVPMAVHFQSVSNPVSYTHLTLPTKA